MNKMALISVSTLPAKNDLLNYVEKIKPYIDFLHCDVMDGHFTPEKCDILKECKYIKKENPDIKLDVHLMVQNPEDYIDEYLKIADIITVHCEAIKNVSQLKRFIDLVHSKGKKIGISLKVSSPLAVVYPHLKNVDLLLLMSVELGESGQIFNDKVFTKLKRISEVKPLKNPNLLIEVDGGINNTNSRILTKMGADILVSGSYIFNESNYQQAILSLKNN